MENNHERRQAAVATSLGDENRFARGGTRNRRHWPPLLIVGTANFFASAGSFEPPRLFWCNFVGMPLLFVGGAMSMFGYMGAFQRYVAGESAPVAKDVVNYMGENVQPGVKAVTKAATEGILEARREQDRKP
jgi:hypothetical protein